MSTSFDAWVVSSQPKLLAYAYLLCADREEARDVVVIGTGIRDELFGKTDDPDDEIIPVGRQMNVNGHPLTIIGMFTHYESEPDRKARELRLLELEQLKASGNYVATNRTGPNRDRGWRGGRA